MERLHSISKVIGDVVQILFDLHILCLLIINVTRTPIKDLEGGFGYTFVSRAYRVIELIAGLVSPLAKR
jgi:hypothetical protein